MELRGFVSLIEIIIFNQKLAVCTDKSVKQELLPVQEKVERNSFNASLLV